MAWPTSPAPHVAEMDENRVRPAVVLETPSVPVERTEAEVPPFELLPLVLTSQFVATYRPVSQVMRNLVTICMNWSIWVALRDVRQSGNLKLYEASTVWLLAAVTSPDI